MQRVHGAVHGAWSRIVVALRQYRALLAEYQPLLERNNEAYVKELSARGAELTLEDVAAQLAEAEGMLETIKTRIPATVRPSGTRTWQMWAAPCMASARPAVSAGPSGLRAVMDQRAHTVLLICSAAAG